MIARSQQKNIIVHVEQIQQVVFRHYAMLRYPSHEEFCAFLKQSHRPLMRCEFQLDIQPFQLTPAINKNEHVQYCDTNSYIYI